LKKVTLVILAAGNSTRFEKSVKKQWLRVGAYPLWKYVVEKFKSNYKFEKIVVVASEDEIAYMQEIDDNNEYIIGANTRQGSLTNSLKNIQSDYVLVSDVARACIPSLLIQNILNTKESFDCVVPSINISDTIVYDNNTIDRNLVKIIQTPQLSRTKILKQAMLQDIEHTDDSSAIKSIGGSIGYIKGSEEAHKITKVQDLKYLKCLNTPEQVTLIGNGFDIHEFEYNTQKEMFLGGVKIDVDYAFKAHSDGDVLIHALIDSILGAMGAGDIGMLFPDTDSSYKNIDSMLMLENVINFFIKTGFIINNVDITIMAQKPKLMRYKSAIKKSIAMALSLANDRVNIKATTTEKLGFIGREEGVAVSCSVSVSYYDWSKA